MQARHSSQPTNVVLGGSGDEALTRVQITRSGIIHLPRRVTRDLKLLGLVGGDVRHGGRDDLCSVGGDYESDRVVLRLAIVRRERLVVRANAAPVEAQPRPMGS